MSGGPEFVLGLHPSARGFGWILFDGARSPFDWGTAYIPRGDNARILVRAQDLFDKYRPRVLVLEEFEKARRTSRIRILCRAIVARAELRNMSVCRVARREVRKLLSPARTRHATARAVAEELKQLRFYMPKKRRLWDAEQPRMSIFTAAACVMAFYAGP